MKKERSESLPLFYKLKIISFEINCVVKVLKMCFRISGNLAFTVGQSDYDDKCCTRQISKNRLARVGSAFCKRPFFRPTFYSLFILR